MGSSDAFIRATINRLGARIGHGLADAAAEIAVLAQDAPDYRILPLASADPIGGTIITDWYNDPGQNNERIKMTIVISGLELRADALRVSMFREKRVNGRWTSVAASARATRQMENIILTKARDYYIARGPR